MIEKRLLSFAEGARGHIAAAVALQWFGLLAGAAVIIAVSRLIGQIAEGEADVRALVAALVVAGCGALLRAVCSALASKAAFRASSGVKRRFRDAVYAKLLALGGAYTETLSTAEALQTATEGVDQLEIYFSKYIPQFFYSILAPVTLFAILAPLDIRAALVLLVGAPLIPALLMMIGKMAGKMMRRQLGSYISLGDRFLENLQGMTALKVYGADAARQEDMAREAEAFRRSTMRILRMQLASIIVMDIVAFGGAAAGVALAALSVPRGGGVINGGDIARALTVALLSAEFFIPLRQLGSLFHVSMNGVAASERMFRLLDMELPPDGIGATPPSGGGISLRAVSYTYPGADRPALDGVTLDIPAGGLVSLVGVSGSGKSTVAALLCGARRGYTGEAALCGAPLCDISRKHLNAAVTLVPHDGYVFSGTVAENLRLAVPDAPDSALISALEKARLWDFFADGDGLDTRLDERGANLSGGQRQRLCLARGLLRDSEIYIFDEAASNIDTQSEAAIMEAVRELAETKTVLLITHRLACAVPSRKIYLLDGGSTAESGTHDELLALGGGYARLYNEQRELENYGGAEL
ncbi:MAG: ABC transporter ATP-binding protein/permease [Oscillospiraceae bacterium]|jgi:ATP-binding cassette subfamily B protein|nr:ABC transporter ATP-binding protein/permease [Oscillospiraceae bacterium]